MRTSVCEAKAHLSKLVEQARRDRWHHAAGKPVAQIIPQKRAQAD